MEIGKLYQINQYYWFLYPSQDIAAAHAAVSPVVGASVCGDAASDAHYWSKRLDCNVSYISPNSMFMLLEKNGKFCKVLTTEGMVGWIILADWCKDNIMEVKSL